MAYITAYQARATDGSYWSSSWYPTEEEAVEAASALIEFRLAREQFELDPNQPDYGLDIDLVSSTLITAANALTGASA